MELKEYFKIFRENSKLFLVVVIGIIMISFGYFTMRPISYSVSLALNITRSGTQQTNDYKYDDFYRMQADEKFAETIVEWLKNPRTAIDVYEKAGIDYREFSLRKLSKIFVSEKLSSQIIAVSFSAKNEASAKKLSGAILEIISKNTKSLNEKQNESSWFEIIAREPVIIRDYVSPIVIFLFSLAGGIFIAFWIVMLRHYLR